MIGDRPVPRLLLVTHRPESNALGRTYCVWLLATSLGWPTAVVSTMGSDIWEPLSGTDFARALVAVDLQTDGGRAQLAAMIDDADLVVAVKPLPGTLGAVHDVARRAGRPVLVDIDDPDIEARTSWRPLSQKLPRRLFSDRYKDIVRLGKVARTLPNMVSNPVLQRIYGGPLVPHVRHVAPVGQYRDADRIVVRFVGTPKRHKGIEVLRAAVRELADEGFVLEITAEAPDDAAPWENWLGTTSFAQGQELVATADIVAIPSLNVGWAPAQLPAKLIDAMMMGRPTVASDIPPIRWALGDTGLLVSQGSVPELTSALRALRGCEERQRYGRAARARAIEMFSVEQVAVTFDRLVADLTGLDESA